MDNGGCPANGWSVITSASTNSQFAGLLAGFVFSGVAILAARSGLRNLQALTVFCAAFPVLGFDSYLFSLVSGGGADMICLRVWSQGEVASGMLGVGGLAVVTGISWLIVGHLGEGLRISGDGDWRPYVIASLDRLSRFMVYGVMVAITLLLAATALDYLEVQSIVYVPEWLTWMVALSPAVVGLVAISMARRRSRVAHKDRTDQLDVTPKVASFGILIYAVLGPIFAGSFARIPDSWWYSDQTLLMSTSLVMGLLVPASLLVLLVHAVPPLGHSQGRDLGDQGDSRREEVASREAPT
jgi:hypothetical protein